MRDFILIGTIIGVFGWLTLSQMNTLGSRAGQTTSAMSASTTSKDSKSKPKTAASQVAAKGGLNASKSVYRTGESGSPKGKNRKRSIKRSSRKASTRRQNQKSEDLLSIYSSEVSSGSLDPVNNSDNQQTSSDTAENETSEITTKNTNVYGVAIKPWILSRRNALAYRPERNDEGGIRVFLQCMELKDKQLEGLNESDCKSLIADRPKYDRPPGVQ